jgi:hypothetical protein
MVLTKRRWTQCRWHAPLLVVVPLLPFVCRMMPSGGGSAPILNGGIACIIVVIIGVHTHTFHIVFFVFVSSFRISSSSSPTNKATQQQVVVAVADVVRRSI